MLSCDIRDEELITAFSAVESLLYSLPLTYQISDPKDDTPLTLYNFVQGHIGGEMAPESVDCTSLNLHWPLGWIVETYPGKDGHK